MTVPYLGCPRGIAAPTPSPSHNKALSRLPRAPPHMSSSERLRDQLAVVQKTPKHVQLFAQDVLRHLLCGHQHTPCLGTVGSGQGGRSSPGSDTPWVRASPWTGDDMLGCRHCF